MARANQQIEGEVSILGHCSFEWIEERFGGYRIVFVGPEHCPRCVNEVRKMGFGVHYAVEEDRQQSA